MTPTVPGGKGFSEQIGSCPRHKFGDGFLQGSCVAKSVQDEIIPTGISLKKPQQISAGF
jgi:hypothetical protein